MPRGIIEGTSFNSNDANIYAVIGRIESEHAARLQRYAEGWRFYNGRHWSYKRDDSEPFVTINYCRKFVDTQVNFLFKNGFKAVIPDDPGTPEKEDDDREFVRLMLEETWRRNRSSILGLEMGQMGAVTGDCWLRASWEEEDPLESPYTRVDVIPSRHVFPEFGGPVGVDRKRVSSILIVFPRYKEVDETTSMRRHPFGAKDRRVELYAERWFPDRVEKYQFRGGEDSGSGSMVAPVVEENPLGEIPIVHIPNYPVAGEYFGVGALADLISLQRELNERATDIGDVIAYHGAPVTILKGAKISELQRGANRMWGIADKDVEVFNLELKGDMSASMKYFEMIKSAMHEIASVPEGLYQFQDASRTSAAALSLRFLPLTESRAVRVQTYGYGLRLMNRLIMKMTAIGDPSFAEKFKAIEGKRNAYRNEVVFGDPIPRDELIELEKSEKRLDLQITSRRKEMERAGLSQREIEKIEDDREAELKREADREFEFGMKFGPEDEQENRSGNPNPKRPSPDIQGEKVSIAAESKATI